jgi:type I restriction enzyme S subunit
MDKLPKGWKIVEWNEVLTIKNGKNQKNVIDENGIYPIYGSGGIMGYANDFICNEETTIIGRKGSINNPIYVTTKFWNVDTAFGICAGKYLDNKFLHYFCVSYDFTKHNKSTTLPSLTKTDLLKIQIPLPPLPEQIRIVSKLDTLFGRIDKSIALLEENIKHTNGLTASVLEEIFVDGKNWERQPLNQVAKVERGKSKHRPRNDQKLFGDSYPFIQTGDVRSANKYIDKYEVCYSEFGLKQSRLWNKGTICLTIAANIGDVAILGFDACFPDSVVGITPNSMNNEFLYYYLKTLQLQLDKKANSAAQKNINLKILSEIDVPVPSIEIQNSIADRFSRLEEKQFQILSVQQSKLNYLKALKSSLLDRAFKGDL